jgi:hypothetical protein
MLKSLSTTLQTSSITGTLGVSNGGSGLGSLGAGYIPYGNGTSPYNYTSNLFFDGVNLGVGTSGNPFGLISAQQNGGNSIVARYNSSNARAGIYTAGGSGSVFFGSNLSYSSGNVFNYDQNGLAYTIGNPNGASFFSINVSSGTAGASANTDNNSNVRLAIFNTGGVSIGNITDPGASNLSVTGTIKTSGALLGSSSTPLSDYEEGTFTPTYSNWTINPTTSNAFYTKVGRQVTINMLCAEGVTAGGGIIGGLPFTSKASQGATAVIHGISSNINGVGSIADNSTQIQNIGAMTNTGYFWTLSVTYIV